MSVYIHELSNWPAFEWNSEALALLLDDVHHKQDHLSERMAALGLEQCQMASLDMLSADVVHTSKIEGEYFADDQVRSALAWRLGVKVPSVRVDRRVEGVVDMVLDATHDHAKDLTHERLFGWHAALFPTGYSGLTKITVAKYRDKSADPMQVVSGPAGREKIHFVAPSGSGLSTEMSEFIEWYEHGPEMDLVLKAAVAHLWIVTIHPFEDGNGRIARAVSDMMLARSEKNSLRFYSMSKQLSEERNDYYDSLERAQKASLDITVWLTWFLECLARAIDGAQTTVDLIQA